PSNSLRRSFASREETMSKRPSGSQSKQIGSKEGECNRTLTVFRPRESIASISFAPQSATHNWRSCQRGDSPKSRSVANVCGGSEVYCFEGINIVHWLSRPHLRGPRSLPSLSRALR